MAIILARHGERLDCAECFTIDAEGCYWDETTDQPWDPPLTASGELQAAGLGRDIMAHLSALQLPPLTHVFTSPFVRCFETAAEIAKVHRLASVCVEPALSEGFDEPFYRSWCVPAPIASMVGLQDVALECRFLAVSCTQPHFDQQLTWFQWIDCMRLKRSKQTLT